VNKYPIHINLI